VPAPAPAAVPGTVARQAAPAVEVSCRATPLDGVLLNGQFSKEIDLGCPKNLRKHP